MDIQTRRLVLPQLSGRYVVAVSGGIDSIVLLDMLTRQTDAELIVAHFDHGIRQDSSEDALFVQAQAQKYGLPFESMREELGQQASEELARTRRYEFLWDMAKKYDAKLITAHHADDIIETIAINLTRGTGWRGLAVLDSSVVRPLLDTSKAELLEYAKEHSLVWHEDSTNKSDAYLRNRLRTKLTRLDDDSKRQLLALWSHQKHAKQEIESQVEQLGKRQTEYSRYFYTHIDETSALELLRVVVDRRLTRPQLLQFLLAIKTAKPGRTYQAGNGVNIDFTSRNFTVKLIK